MKAPEPLLGPQGFFHDLHFSFKKILKQVTVSATLGSFVQLSNHITLSKLSKHRACPNWKHIVFIVQVSYITPGRSKSTAFWEKNLSNCKSISFIVDSPQHRACHRTEQRQSLETYKRQSWSTKLKGVITSQTCQCPSRWASRCRPHRRTSRREAPNPEKKRQLDKELF